MLKHLQIRNLAIIDELEIDTDKGFTALTGETGAGKSILIDAIGLVIGTRADPLLVRHGEEKAEISAEFAIKAPVTAWLKEHELDDEDNAAACLLRRVVYAEGRTRAFVNGKPVNAGQLRELGEQLIEVFGQSESQTLMRVNVQRDLLDNYGGYSKPLDAVAAAAAQYAELQRQIERLRGAGPKDPAKLDYLKFQLQELAALGLAEGEVAQIEAEHRKLANGGRLQQEGGGAQETLYGGENSLYDQLSSVQSQVAGLVPLHAGFADSLALIESAQTQLQEAADGLRRQLDRLDLDPERFAEVEKRMAAIHDLARKHRIQAAELPVRLAALQQEVDETENAAGRVTELEQQQAAVLKTYKAAALTLSDQRRKAAKKFSSGVTEVVRTLGMSNAQFLAAVEPAAGDTPRAHGDDEIRFDFSANPGQPPRPLAKVASGGELSRLSLALQVVALAQGGAPCMIFDEVDAGIGGGVAEIVGQTLRKLGSARQVLCVTHLAQVAAQADQQFGIRKEVRSGKTYTQVNPLDETGRVEELARMQGGVKITDAALTHARELLKRRSRA